MTTLEIDLDDYNVVFGNSVPTLEFTIDSGTPGFAQSDNTIETSNDASFYYNNAGYVDSVFFNTDKTISQINEQSSDWSNVVINKENSPLNTISININFSISDGPLDLSGTYLWGFVVWDVTGSGADNISIHSQFYLKGDATATINNADNNSISVDGDPSKIWVWTDPTEQLPSNFIITMVDQSTQTHDRVILAVTDNCLASFTRIPCLIYDKQLNNTCMILSKIEDVKIGDEIETNIGNQKISRVMKTINIGGKCEYVKFSANCFGNNIPYDDIYMTKAHPLSLGYFDTKYINDGIKDESQSDKVFVHIEA